MAQKMKLIYKDVFPPLPASLRCRLCFLGYLFNGGSGLQSVVLRRRLLAQVTPLLPQGADPLLDGPLIGRTLFGQQILTSSQNPCVQGLLGLELRLQNLTQVNQLSFGWQMQIISYCSTAINSTRTHEKSEIKQDTVGGKV